MGYCPLQLPRKIAFDNWASEASPTLGCSIEISRDIYIYMSVPEEVVHAHNVIAFFVWAWRSRFVTEVVPLGELLHEEALFGLTGVRKVGVPQ